MRRVGEPGETPAPGVAVVADEAFGQAGNEPTEAVGLDELLDAHVDVPRGNFVAPRLRPALRQRPGLAGPFARDRRGIEGAQVVAAGTAPARSSCALARSSCALARSSCATPPAVVPPVARRIAITTGEQRGRHQDEQRKPGDRSGAHRSSGTPRPSGRLGQRGRA